MNDLVVPDASTVIYDSAVGGLTGWREKPDMTICSMQLSLPEMCGFSKSLSQSSVLAYMHASETQKL